MGVSIYMNGKNITPGWRSMLYQMLLDNFGTGSPLLGKSDISKLTELRDKQYLGSEHPSEQPPFNYSPEIAEKFGMIIARIKKRGSAQIESYF